MLHYFTIFWQINNILLGCIGYSFVPTSAMLDMNYCAKFKLMVRFLYDAFCSFCLFVLMSIC